MVLMPDKSGKKQHPVVRLFLTVSSTLGLFLYMMPTSKRQKALDELRVVRKSVSNSLYHYLIPHAGNNYRPRIFEQRSVRHLIIGTLAIKIIVVSLLFAAYPNQGYQNSNVKDHMYSLINEYRTSKGDAPLAVTSYLETTADSKANDMVAKAYFSHYGPDGKKPWEWIDKKTYNFSAMGENLAMDFLTAQPVFKAFQDSPAHNKNLLEGAFSEIGIAIESGVIDGHDTNVMVVFFGHPQGVTAVAKATPKPATDTAVVVKPTVQKVAATPTTRPKPAPAPLNISKNESAPLAVAPAQPAVVAQPTTINVVDRLTIQPRQNTAETDTVLGVAINTDPSSSQPSLYLGSSLQQTPASARGSWLQYVNQWSNNFFFVLLIAFVVILLINIFVKIRVQHVSILGNALMLIFVQVALLSLHVHAAQAFGETVRILGYFLM